MTDFQFKNHEGKVFTINPRFTPVVEKNDNVLWNLTSNRVIFLTQNNRVATILLHLYQQGVFLPTYMRRVS